MFFSKTRVFKGSEVLAGQRKNSGFPKKTPVLTQNSMFFQKLRVFLRL